MDHSPGFLKLVNDAKTRVREVTIEQARERLKQNTKAVLMDVREDREWQKEHAVEAVHLGKGILERDLEKLFPDPATEIIMYCGGGFRSALTCDAAQKMGYRNVHSLAGGYKALVQLRLADEERRVIFYSCPIEPDLPGARIVSIRSTAAKVLRVGTTRTPFRQLDFKSESYCPAAFNFGKKRISRAKLFSESEA